MSPLAERIVNQLRSGPQQFSEIVDLNRDIPWPEFLRAWGEIRGMETLGRDGEGHYVLTTGNSGPLDC